MTGSSRKKAIFVHGCMWHGHEGCRNNRRPNTRQEYWNPKLDANKRRDAENEQKLIDLGWSVFIVWECETKMPDALSEKIDAFLKQAPNL